MRWILVLLAVLFVTGCGSIYPETKFSEDGISFTCPEGWNFERVYMSPTEKNALCERTTFNMYDSAFFSLQWEKVKEKQFYLLDDILAQLEEEFKGEDITVTDMEMLEYKGHEAGKFSFTYTDEDATYVAEYISLYCGEKAVIVTIGFTYEKENKFGEALKKIEESFVCS